MKINRRDFMMTASSLFYPLTNCSNPVSNKEQNQILISFRIDDIDFNPYQRSCMENATYLARKYKITFDLGVVAKRFEERRNNEVYGIYQANQDIFEIVAHGFTHANPVDPSKRKGEFYDVGYYTPIPPDLQESHIHNMKLIFEKYGMEEAKKIFLLPWHAGDENTIKLAEKYGYRLMTMEKTPDGSPEYKYGNLIVSNVFVSVAMFYNLSNQDISSNIQTLDELIEAGQKNIQIVMHLCNFDTKESSKGLINDIFNNPYIEYMKFGFISERLNEP